MRKQPPAQAPPAILHSRYTMEDAKRAHYDPAKIRRHTRKGMTSSTQDFKLYSVPLLGLPNEELIQRFYHDGTYLGDVLTFTFKGNDNRIMRGFVYGTHKDDPTRVPYFIEIEYDKLNRTALDQYFNAVGKEGDYTAPDLFTAVLICHDIIEKMRPKDG